MSGPHFVGGCIVWAVWDQIGLTNFVMDWSTLAKLVMAQPTKGN